jgi:hypothetical protein
MPQKVLDTIAQIYPPDDCETVRERLPSKAELHISETPEWDRLYERVLLAIVNLSDGDMGELDHEIRAARQDWRDVLLWHEGWS